MRHNPLNISVHALRTRLLHLVGNVTVNIKRESCCCVPEVALHRLDIVPAFDGCYGITMPQIMEAGVFISERPGNILEVFVDRNMNQIDGTTEDVMALEPLDKKFEAFGWDVRTIDGHDTEEIVAAVNKAKQTPGKPHMLIARTVKGKGISFMENQYKWHSGQITQEQFEQGLRDLEGA